MSCQIFEKLEAVIRQRIAEGNPQSYTYRLYSSGVSTIARKVGEEAVEVAVAALAEGRERVVEESADLLYHLLVLLNSLGLSLGDVCKELERRMK
ncbi:phosphoribosyl-ATP diphosphatase [Pyrobaculum aerophilum]|uniref:Phosphoribosyl-ATP pyrophosphatase n=2 Tax=Pyrobaculum aerophilum TaxID=13773 RepID=HIS2_PYRAE|nr:MULTISPECIES: phosphoribosyl-ATP diphosphatase [Pyrobaculum]Q8ZY18.1 RecName: Full=Phosphoribosyl-ATP pyrophosphatase; Short=PRA-PH [Pyrobaculum aerophilum str. IM2]AAL63178.1 phosphoribosyl-ATP pyrophosphohydrolase [Pyrobaculum aerophilum str. IM2]RFA98499.1 phosphoribosyl-ATP diphosphatase [Pyrobaculum aerophilum]RFA99989.1 phosphoribosyl-ATP diphosphatase [Pyrobaculum aerophilum]HII48060.1 phosphoribosyl-ATP diphosphatase [Pyrobaculum aerophilum]